MNTHLVLDAAHVDTPVALVVDEHGETTAIAGTGLRTGQHKVQVRVTVGDETLAAVQTPATGLLVVGGLQHHALQVRTRIRLREVHGHCLTGADAGDETAVLVLVAKLIERLDAVLQRPDVLETGIRRRNHLVGSRIDRVGEVQSPEAAGHRHTVQTRLDHGI